MEDQELEERYNSRNQQLRTTPDWELEAFRDEHLWVTTNASGDLCYVSETCSKRGSRLKCSSCKVIVHQNCLNQLVKDEGLRCRSTFEDKSLGQYRRKTTVDHHWVRRYSEKSKCEHCTKSFQCKISFSTKEITSVSCTWCKSAFHNRDSCFNLERIGNECSLGAHRSVIVPPNWIIKLRQEQVQSDDQENKNQNTKGKSFIVRAIPASIVEIKPIIVFINPKSGGNQGLRLLQKFQWLLNPRQIFDLTQGGPKMGLELYRKVNNLRVLACGGDGTVGWVLSVIDQIGISPPPAVGVLPLGTGNDLARALGWGGGYTDEPVAEILSNMSNSVSVLLDRWKVEVEKNPDGDDDESGKSNLPLNVINNYFSMGVDAHIALEFHEAREAHPAKFNSRLKNKMFYGQLGGKDLLQRKWRSLTDFITLECDGQDFTPKLRELKVHAIVFLNISSYGGGTRPWNNSLGSTQPSTEDGLIEVVGLTTYQLPLLQAGGHGTCITQCKTAKIVTSRTIPMQVDGEACKVAPSILTISLLNKAIMLANKKCGIQKIEKTKENTVEVNVSYLGMQMYEKFCQDRDVMKKSATQLHTFEIQLTNDLGTMRDLINNFVTNSKDECLLNDWYFLDGGCTGKMLKIDREEEHLHYVFDILNDNDLFLLECINETRPLTPKSDTGNDSPKSEIEIKPMKKVAQENKPKDMKPEPKIKTPVAKPPVKARPPTFHCERVSVQKRLFDLKDYSSLNNRMKYKTLYETIVTAFHSRDLQVIEKIQRQGQLKTVQSPEGYNLLNSALQDSNEDLAKFMIKYVFTNFQKVEHLCE